MDYVTKIEESKLNAAVEAEEMTLFSMLKPKIYRDGNLWCVLYGENIQEGICGFGDTPRQAVWAFNREWDRSITDIRALAAGMEAGKC